MHRILDVFRFELARNLRRGGYLFTTFGIPIIGLVLFFGWQLLGNQNPDEAMQQGVETASEVADDFAPDADDRYGYVDSSGLLADVEAPLPFIAYVDEPAARAALDGGTIQGYYTIPADYVQSGEFTLVQPRFGLSGVATNGAMRSLLIGALARDLPPEVVARVVHPTARVQVTNLSLSEANADAGEDASFVLVYVFAAALGIGLFVTNGYLLQGVIEEKETRMVEVLISALRPGELLAGKVLSAALLGLVQMAAWLGAIVLAFVVAGSGALQAVGVLAQMANIRIPFDVLPLLFLFFLLAYFLFAALYAIVGAMSNSLREGPQFAVLFSLPAIAPIYFIGLFTDSPDAALPTIMSLFPITAPVAMTMRLLISPVPAWQIILSMALLIAAGAGAIWLAGRIFRAGALLAGQPIRLKDLPALVRG